MQVGHKQHDESVKNLLFSRCCHYSRKNCLVMTLNRETFFSSIFSLEVENNKKKTHFKKKGERRRKEDYDKFSLILNIDVVNSGT